MARYLKAALVAVSFLSANSMGLAQSLAEESRVNRVMDVTQFGMPQDAKWIFCDGVDCPDRTKKTITAPKPVVAQAQRQASPPVVVPQAQSVQLPAELSQAKVKPVKHLKKKTKRKPPRAPRTDCGPDQQR